MWFFCGHKKLQIVKDDLIFNKEPFKDNIEQFGSVKYTIYHSRCYDCGKITYNRYKQ